MQANPLAGAGAGGMAGGAGMAGGMAGGMGGGMMGGGMGGGMMGGMGGGMGGGMMGGMGGGMFDVADEVSLDSVKPTSRELRPSKPQMIQVNAQDGNLSDAWDAYFRQPLENIDEASLRLTLRKKMSARQIQDVVVILQSALRHGYVRPWMYEALSLAMQASQAPKSEIERAIMSAVDLTDSPEEIMMAAVYLSKNGFKPRAFKLFREVADANPLRPEPFIQGLELASELNDIEGVQWAVTNILSQAWPKEQKHYQNKAIRIAQSTLKQLMNSSLGEAQEFRQAISEAIVRDCEVTVSWTGEADLDALVEEPGGTVCSLRNVRTTSGGVLLGDSFAHDTNESETISETYVCPKGFSGRYRMLIRRIWGEVTAGKVTVDVYINRHTPDEKHIRKQIPLSDKDALIVFDVENGRRTEALEEHQVASVVNAQAALNRTILAQRLNQVTESEAVTNLAIARARAGGPRGRVPFFRNRGAVGYRPELTVLPEGTMLMAQAVISADRRYVRYSGLPFFSAVGKVEKFNFVTGGTGIDQNAGGGLGGGGLGGGGFGGGGFGGGGFGGGF